MIEATRQAVRLLAADGGKRFIAVDDDETGETRLALVDATPPKNGRGKGASGQGNSAGEGDDNDAPRPNGKPLTKLARSTRSARSSFQAPPTSRHPPRRVGGKFA